MRVKRKDLNAIIKNFLNEETDVLHEVRGRYKMDFKDYGDIKECDFSEMDGTFLAMILSAPQMAFLSREEKIKLEQEAIKNPETMSRFKKLSAPQREAINNMMNLSLNMFLGPLAGGLCSLINDMARALKKMLVSWGVMEPGDDFGLAKEKERRREALAAALGLAPLARIAVKENPDLRRIKRKMQSQRINTTDINIFLFPGLHNSKAGGGTTTDNETALNADIITIDGIIGALGANKYNYNNEKDVYIDVFGVAVLSEYERTNPDGYDDISKDIESESLKSLADDIIESLEDLKEDFLAHVWVTPPVTTP